MAVSLLESHHISELCLGKPPLTSLPLSATVADAFAALKSSDDPFLSVWDCHCCHRRHHAAAAVAEPHCRCVGKVSMADVICFLSRLDHRYSSPSSALATPISRLISNNAPALITHLDPSSRLSEAIDLILQGTQNLIIPIKRRQTTVSRKKQSKTTLISSSTTTIHNGTEFCWLTQEDVIRFLLSSIGLFSSIAPLSVETLGIISADAALTADYHSPAISAIDLISKSLADQTSVAVVDADGVLIGEISPQTLASCDETVAAAIATLSAGGLMAYIDGGGPPPEDLVRAVNRRMEERSLGAIIKEFSVLFSESSSSSSSDEESAMVSPTTTLARRYGRSASYSARMVRRAEAIVCHPKSSLVAVMIQAIAHRVSYVWVVDDDSCLVGIVTFSEILRVFRECTMP